MRVLAHIHTLNDEAVIGQILEGLRRQTRPPDAVIIVDNGSTDATLDREFPSSITVVRHGRNLGTSGAIVTGMKHALAHGFDWIWLFDADSVPGPDALEKLLAFYDDLPKAEKEPICFLACRLMNAEDEVRHKPVTFNEFEQRILAGRRGRRLHQVRLFHLDWVPLPHGGGREDWPAVGRLRARHGGG